MAFVREVIEAIKAIDPDIMVEQAAGITSGRQVYDFIMAGSEAAGAASGIINAEDRSVLTVQDSKCPDEAEPALSPHQPYPHRQTLKCWNMRKQRTRQQKNMTLTYFL